MKIPNSKIQIPEKLQASSSKASLTRGIGFWNLVILWNLVFGFWNFPVHGSIVYETAAEFLSAGDFNGDGIADVLVLDKSTGNARVGYQDTNGVLAWSASLFTGVDAVSGAGVGRFLQADRDTLAVTSLNLNGIPLDDLSNSNSFPTAFLVTPTGIGPHTLAGFANPLASADALFVASAFNNAPAERVEAVIFHPGPILSYTGLFNETGSVARASGVSLDTNVAAFVAAIVRGTNSDALHLWQFTNSASLVATFSNLPPGSDFAIGTFNHEPLPRFWFYTPGRTNVSISALATNGAGLDFGATTTLAFTQAVERVYILSSSNDDSAVIQFSDGVQAVRLPGGVPALAPKYPGSVTGVAPLGAGNFALLTAPAGTLSSLAAQVVNFNGTGYTLISSNALPPLTTHGNRANVWLFQSEPFVNGSPGFVSSLTAPDWSGNVSGLPGSIVVRVETDSGAASGLGNPATNNLGAAPAGSAFGLPDQYRDDISLFSYSAPSPAGGVDATIAPAPGLYDGPITITFTKQHSFDTVLYRLDAAAWQTYASPFALTHNATIQFYARSPGGALAARSPLHNAAYVLGATGEVPPAPVVLTNGVFTNPPPVINTNLLEISTAGTVFYSRRNTNNNATTIWTINLDGTGETFLTPGLRPRVTRDGHWMAFLRENDPATNQFSLWVRDLTTAQETRLHSSSNRYVGLDWSTDGASIVFDNNCLFWRIGLSGPATQLPLPSDCRQGAPGVNPVDGRIAFQIIYPGTLGLYLAPSNAASKQMVVLSVLSPRWPMWSPDGQRVAIADDPSISQSIDAGFNLWVVDFGAQTNAHQITALTGDSAFPHGAIWRPDGHALIGAGKIGGTNGLWLIPLAPDGGACHCQPLLLPTSPGDAIDFAGSIVVAPPATVATPGLFIRKEPNAIVVYWSTIYDGFILESSTGVGPNAFWTEIDGPYFLAGAYYEYHEARSALVPTKFFRLRYPGIFFLTPPEAELSFALQSNQAVVTWSGDYVGYTLESATNLAPPVWLPVGGSYGITNGQFEFRQNFNPGKPREFFRLRWP